MFTDNGRRDPSKLEKRLAHRFSWLIYSSIVITLILLLGIIAGLYFDIYYKCADGFSYLLGFAAWCGALIFKAWLKPEQEVEPDQIATRLISYFICIGFTGVYLAVQCMLLTNQCTDAVYLAAHCCENAICTTGYPALIATIVYSSVFIACFIVLFGVEVSILPLARRYVKNKHS
jgi:hypothetical protein